MLSHQSFIGCLYEKIKSVLLRRICEWGERKNKLRGKHYTLVKIFQNNIKNNYRMSYIINIILHN
jgi:hypothetical protein